jgi:hypothetical protein
MTMSRTFALNLLLSVSLLATAPASATVLSSSGTVIQVVAYAEFGGGDFTFRLSNYPPGCAGGFWLSPNQLGFKTNVALILAARAKGQSLTVGGDNAQIWTGSASPFCKVYRIIEED